MIGILICSNCPQHRTGLDLFDSAFSDKCDGWKIVAFIGLCVLPALCIVGGMNTHMQRSEQTKFCISCHAMENYGKSLYLNDPKYIPAQHFQNHRVPPDMACYSCHTDYTIYGPLKDKLKGLTRIYMQYVSTPPNPITDTRADSRTPNACTATLAQGTLRKTPSTLR